MCDFPLCFGYFGTKQKCGWWTKAALPLVINTVLRVYLWSSLCWVFRIGRVSTMWRRVIRIKFCLALENIRLDSVCLCVRVWARALVCLCLCVCVCVITVTYTPILHICSSATKMKAFARFISFLLIVTSSSFPHSLSFTSNFIRALIRSLSTVRGHSVILTFCLRSWLLSDLSARPSDLLLQWRQEH